MVRDGFGMQENVVDGSVYEGLWENDMMSGVGRMTWNNADVYHGEWRYNKANGKGIFVDNQGSTYDGEWVDDQQHGLGFESWENGAITFRGMYAFGKKNG